MQLRIYPHKDSKIFPSGESDPLSERILNEGGQGVSIIKVNPSHLIAEVIWELKDQSASSKGIFISYDDEQFFPSYGLMINEKAEEPLPFLKTLKELSIKGGASLTLVDIRFGYIDEAMIPKEFNEKSDRDINLLERFFRWTPEKLDQLIDNIIEANQLGKFVDEEIARAGRETGLLKDEAGKNRYLDVFNSSSTV